MDTYSGKTVLVVGATGLIGSNLVHALMKRRNIRIIAMGRTREKLEKCFKEYLGSHNFLIIEQDISKTLYIEERLDYIFHAAGPISGSTIEHNPLQVIFPNISGTQNCLEFLRRQKEEKGFLGRMIVFSSATVYGPENGDQWLIGEDETQGAEGLSSKTAPYSETKRMTEVLALSYARQYGLDVVIARFSYVYGYSFYMPETAFYQTIDQVIRGENIAVLSQNQTIRDYIFIEDAVAGVLLIGEKGVSHQAYNVSSNGDLENYMSFDQIANHIVNAANTMGLFDGKLKLTLPQQGIFRSCGIKLKNQKLKELGWSVETTPESGILKTLQYRICNLGNVHG